MIRIALVAMCVLLTATATAALRDPTQPPTHTGGTVYANVSDFTVTSTLVSKKRSVAMVNGQLVNVGDKVAGAIVKKISPGTVTLEIDQQNAVFHVIPQTVRGSS